MEIILISVFCVAGITVVSHWWATGTRPYCVSWKGFFLFIVNMIVLPSELSISYPFFFFFFPLLYWGLNPGTDSRPSNHLSHSPAPLLPFALVIFQVGSHVFAQEHPQTSVFLPLASHVAGIADVLHHTLLINWSGVLLTFYLGWPGTMVFLIPAFWVTEVIGLSHHTNLHFPTFT
jgi:hypothetical protein